MSYIRKAGWKILWAKYSRGKAVVHVSMGRAGEMRLTGKPTQTIEDIVSVVNTDAIRECARVGKKEPWVKAPRRTKRTDKQAAVAELILWRRRRLAAAPVSPEVLAESLSVEKLDYADTPEWFKAALTAFRRLRQDARVAACRRALDATKENDHG